MELHFDRDNESRSEMAFFDMQWLDEISMKIVYE